MEATTCPNCHAPANGKFCSSCGAPLGPTACAGCGAPLTPGAQFCHRCGRPASGGGAAWARAHGKGPWIFAAVASIILVGYVIYIVNRGVEVAPPPAGRTGGANAPFATSEGGGTPPDISQMSGRERFLRLHDRIMGSLEQGDSATAAQFTPMALQAYGMLTPDERDIDIRYHAATLMLGGGDIIAATALTDSIAREAPSHLFVDMLRAGIAEAKNDRPAARRAYAKFIADFDAQVATGRREYVDHRPLLDAFKERAAQLK
jgi:hypothetical protein